MLSWGNYSRLLTYELGLGKSGRSGRRALPGHPRVSLRRDVSAPARPRCCPGRQPLGTRRDGSWSAPCAGPRGAVPTPGCSAPCFQAWHQPGSHPGVPPPSWGPTGIPGSRRDPGVPQRSQGQAAIPGSHSGPEVLQQSRGPAVIPGSRSDPGVPQQSQGQAAILGSCNDPGVRQESRGPAAIPGSCSNAGIPGSRSNPGVPQ